MRTVPMLLGVLTIAGVGQLTAAWSQNSSPVVLSPALPAPQQSLPVPLPQQELPQPGLPQPGIALPGAAGAGASPSQLPHSGNLPNAPRSNPHANLPGVTIREFRSNVQEAPA